jgi:AraC-like DNA-binding protein
MPTGNDRPSGVPARSSGTALVDPAVAESDGADILSDVLRAVRLSGALFFLTDASCPWSVEIPSGSTLIPLVLPGAQQLISYHVVISGCLWYRGPGVPEQKLEAGDVVVIPQGGPYALSNPHGLRGDWPEQEVLAFFRSMAGRELPFVVPEGGGGPERLQVLCGFLGCDMLPFNPALDALPPMLRVPRPPHSPADRLSQLIDFAMEESRERKAGSDCVLLRIAELMFVEVVRRHLATMAPDQTGWLAGLRDPIVARALALLHRQTSRPWTLQSLARESGLSRSALSERFMHFVGTPPIQYLARWRMQTATRLLRDGNAKISAVAAEVGYESEAAFSRAFTREVGVRPAAWRKRQLASRD